MEELAKVIARSVVYAAFVLTVAMVLCSSPQAQSSSFHDAPASAKEMVNPFEDDPQAAVAGKPLYHLRCARCHGEKGEGSGNIPAFAHGKISSVTSGELFWFITKGDVPNGMPAWGTLPKQQKWQIITYVKALASAKAVPGKTAAARPRTGSAQSNAPPPRPPFTDYRFEKPGNVRKITLNDLPPPFTTPSAGNGPKLVARPEGAWPQVPKGFEVEQYAAGLDEPRLIRTAPNGDFFVAESHAGDIRVFRGINGKGKPELMEVFASGLDRPFGINFYPPGPDPLWVYVGNTDAVVRFPYRNGDTKARGPAEHIADVPAGESHWTRTFSFLPTARRCLSR